MQYTDNNTVVVVPCYNEEKHIGGVVQGISKYVKLVFVADDNSSDGTIVVARQAGALAVSSSHKRGFGRNMLFGFKQVIKLYSPEIIITVDGDGQHNPDEINEVMQPILDGDADIVIGSRFIKKYTGPKYRKLGIDIITYIYNVGHKEKITDAQSCYRAYRREVIEALDIRDGGFGFSTEILIKARKKGFRIKEVPVDCIYHEDLKSNSTMNPIKQGLLVSMATLKWRVIG
jgi:glycosyltransferase involved in cell wall biosynthesis